MIELPSLMFQHPGFIGFGRGLGFFMGCSFGLIQTRPLASHPGLAAQSLWFTAFASHHPANLTGLSLVRLLDQMQNPPAELDSGRAQITTLSASSAIRATFATEVKQLAQDAVH